MKGIVFVELLEMAESLLGEDVVDDILSSSELTSGGAYTSVGIYPCSDLMTLVQAFSAVSQVPAADLQRKFGHWMLQRFAQGYPEFFLGKPDALTMLESIEGEVHVEVRKLYPEVELPRFDSLRLPGGPGQGDGLQLTYQSPRPLGDFCHGLVEACVDHFGHPATVSKENIVQSGAVASRFTIRLAGEGRAVA